MKKFFKSYEITYYYTNGCGLFPAKEVYFTLFVTKIMLWIRAHEGRQGLAVREVDHYI